MRCKESEFVEGAVFHFYNRSVDECKLFREHKDYLYFLSKFKKAQPKEVCEIFAYCLMPNHFHFCLRQNTLYPINKIFNKFITSYAMYYNCKYNRKGCLFAGKLQHKQLKSDKYLIALCKYIHYNPMKSKLVNSSSEWEYSNLLEYTGSRNGTLYSKDLTKMYPEVFENYEQTLSEYSKFMNEKLFSDILLDE